MARIRKNKLTIESLPNGSFRLFGYILGRKIRKQSANYSELENEKSALERQLADSSSRPTSLRQTWLTEDQLRDAEAAYERSGGRRLLPFIEAGEKVMPTSDPVLLTKAKDEWITWLTDRRRQERTIDKNGQRMQAFIAALPADIKNVHEVEPKHIEKFVFSASADNTRATHGQVIRAWCNYWVSRRWVKVSPFEVDMRDLEMTAKPVELPKILEPEKCRKLMVSALTLYGTRFGAYVGLATWCFLRHAEVLRVTVLDLKHIDDDHPIVAVRPRKRGTPSYREVDVPKCFLPILRAARDEVVAEAKKQHIKADDLDKLTVIDWSKRRWGSVRADAGLIKLGPLVRKTRFRRIIGEWQENLLRHTGISYLHQQTKNIKDVTRQAGDTDETAYAHYIRLPAPKAHEVFFEQFNPKLLALLKRKKVPAAAR